MSFDPVPLDPQAAPASSNTRFRPVPVSGVEPSGAGGEVVPAPPETGTFVLTSTDGVLSWEVPAQ